MDGMHHEHHPGTQGFNILNLDDGSYHPQHNPYSHPSSMRLHGSGGFNNYSIPLIASSLTPVMDYRVPQTHTQISKIDNTTLPTTEILSIDTHNEQNLGPVDNSPNKQAEQCNNISVNTMSEFTDKCLVCKIVIHKDRGSWMDIHDCHSSTSDSQVADLIIQLVLKSNPEKFQFTNTTICRRCYNLLDRADELQEQIKLSKSELRAIKKELRESLSIASSESIVNKEEQENTAESSNENEEDTVATSQNTICDTLFNCRLCPAQGFPNKDILAQHFDQAHSDNCNVECRLCTDSVTGGVKSYLLHMATKHPNIPLSEGQGVIKMIQTKTQPILSSKDQVVKKKRGRPVQSNYTKIKRLVAKKRVNVFKSRLKQCISGTTIKKFNIKCPICKVNLSSLSLKKHLFDNHADQDSFNCPQCIEEFVQVEEFSSHLIDVHKDVFKKKISSKLKIRNGKILGIPVNDDESIVGTTMVKCPVCLDTLQQRCLQNHYNRIHAKVKPFSCVNCSRSFYKKDELENHMERAHNEKLPTSTPTKKEIDDKTAMVKCPKCDKILQKRCLQSHDLRIHVREKRFTCTVCSKSFYTASSMMTHKDRMHNQRTRPLQKLFSKRHEVEVSEGNEGDKTKYETAAEKERKEKVPCPVCNASITRRTLDRHINDMHTFKKTYKCGVCQETFNKFTHLRTHKRNVHAIGTLAKKHLCPICGVTFVHPNEVRKHIAIRHENKRDHLCEICGDKFQRVSALNLHKRKHSGVRPFLCKICGKTFSRSDDCKKHIRKVHNLECFGRLNNPFTSHLLPYEKLPVPSPTQGLGEQYQ